MTTGEEADENAIDHLLLADDDLTDFAAHLIEVAGGELEWGVGSHVSILAVEAGEAGKVVVRNAEGRGEGGARPIRKRRRLHFSLAK